MSSVEELKDEIRKRMGEMKEGIGTREYIDTVTEVEYVGPGNGYEVYRVRSPQTGGYLQGSFNRSAARCSVDNIESGFPESVAKRGIGTAMLSKFLSEMYEKGAREFCSTPYSPSAEALYNRFVRMGVLGEVTDRFPASGRPHCWELRGELRGELQDRIAKETALTKVTNVTKVTKNSHQLERILGSRIGWRYLPSEVTDAGEVLRFEIEELRNEHILMEAQERFGVCPDVDWDRWSEMDEADQVFILDSLLAKIRDRFGHDAEALWVTSTRKEASWYASGKPQPEEFERYCIPENAAVISDMGSQGALLVASKKDWEGCFIG